MVRKRAAKGKEVALCLRRTRKIRTGFAATCYFRSDHRLYLGCGCRPSGYRPACLGVHTSKDNEARTQVAPLTPESDHVTVPDNISNEYYLAYGDSMSNPEQKTLKDKTLKLLSEKLGDGAAKEIETRIGRVTGVISKSVQDNFNQETVTKAGRSVGRAWTKAQDASSNFRATEFPKLLKTVEDAKDHAQKSLAGFKVEELREATREVKEVYEISSQRGRHFLANVRLKIRAAILFLWKWLKRFIIFSILVSGVYFTFYIYRTVTTAEETSATMPKTDTSYRDPANDFVLKLLDKMCADGDASAC